MILKHAMFKKIVLKHTIAFLGQIMKLIGAKECTAGLVPIQVKVAGIGTRDQPAGVRLVVI